MNWKKYLKKIQKLVPQSLLFSLQSIHSKLLFNWILCLGSQPLEFTPKSAMVFSPHQDDETFGCGGIIALKREQGIPVTVTFLTDGQGNGGLLPRSPEQIIELRKQEALTALQCLGVDKADIHFLEKPDGKLQNLQEQERKYTIEQLVELLKLHQPQEVYVPHSKDCHQDHEATYNLVKEAIAQAKMQVDILQYPIWLMWRAPLFLMLKLSDISFAYRLSITGVQSKKFQAINSYNSQIESLPPGFVKRFLGANEVFFKAKF